jgi:hypothetical protein
MGKASNRKHAAKLGYQPLNASMLAQMVAGMRAQLADPNSPVSQYTKMCRAQGIPCLQDKLDAGQTIEQIARESVFVK